MSKELRALDRIVCRLQDKSAYNHICFEDVGIIEQALKRNEPMKPIYVEDCSYVGTACPSCRGYNVRDEEYTIKRKYCPDCGQRLDWSED